MSTTSANKAKKFFVNRILEQAKRDGVSLSAVEIQMPLLLANGVALTSGEFPLAPLVPVAVTT